MANGAAHVHRMPMNQNQLRDHAKWLAESHRTSLGKGHDVLLRGLAQNEKILIQSYKIVEDAARSHQRVVPAAVWFLDNFYVIEEQIWLARRHLPKSYSIQLPRLDQGELAGFPRVYSLMSELIKCNDGTIDEPSINTFVDSYQETNPLLIGELWAIPLMLRFALIQNARDTAARIATGSIDRNNANRWADKIATIDADDSNGMLQIMAQLTDTKPRMSETFIAEFARRLQSQNPTPALPMGWLEQFLGKQKRSLDEIYHHESQHEAADQVNMSHTITSMRMLESVDWRTFVENTSQLESILRKDPAGAYRSMDFATRDRYRHAVEEISKRYHVDETTVAEMSVKLCLNYKEKSAKSHRKAHVGYYLIGYGREEFLAALVTHHNLRMKIERFCQRNLGNSYFTFVIFSTIVIATWVTFIGTPRSLLWWKTLLFWIPASFVASQLALSAGNWLATLIIKPKRLARMEISGKIPPEWSTVVVVPTMLSSANAIKEILHSLEANFLANRDQNLHFALLTDFLDAKLETSSDDEYLLKSACDSVTLLNEKYAYDAPFFLFHRARKWNASERLWMGYERKRGKLMEFAEALRSNSFSAFMTIVGNPSKLINTKYIITLDSDTRLPHNAARHMIGTMAHPLNQPVISSELGRVIDGYTILQPRVAVEFQSANRTWFTKLFSGDPSIDPYTREISDVYQDLFGEGSFIGKGIFEVDSFLETLKEKLPENWILSHDLIESCVARSGLISDVILYEQFPSQFQADVSRRHRWIRGDWQISPWLFTHKRRQPSERGLFSLSMLSRWKIMDNLRRSLLPFAMILTLFLGWTTEHSWTWAAFVLAVVFLPTVLTSIRQALLKNVDQNLLSHLAHTGYDFIISGAHSLLTIIFLPYEAWRNLDAIARAIFRMTLGKKRLLEWRPAHEVEQSLNGSLTSQLREMGPVTLVVFALIQILGSSELPGHQPALFLSLWVMAPITAWLISKPMTDTSIKLNPEDHKFLSDIAKKTWSFFESYVTEQDHWLPPDNVQFAPEKVVAHRTSPTNIGLYLLSCFAAFDFGYLTLDQLIQRLELTMATMEKLERFRGHFYNWYDTETLKPLAPAYVSTVDSGNLTASLYAIAAALEQLELETSLDPKSKILARIKLAAQKARDLGNCDYRFLYNRSRRLLSIGYNVQEQRLDSSYYDLLASESRLASLFAIALGQIPVEHWYALGRLMNRIGRERILLSWSGSMFEYLMPMLILPDYDNTLLSETHKAAVHCQVAYGKLRGVPWGFSESGYFATDINNNYQYRAFGVPGLGFKRGLGQDLVVAPYASMMAVMVAPTTACENLRRLHREGFTGEHGYYEAIDYTTSRIPPSHNYAIVRSYMAHHQGMGFLALAHQLLARPIQRRFVKSPLFQSVAILLEEGRPATVPFPLYGTETPEEIHTSHELEGAVRVLKEPSPSEPSIQLLSNGSYHVMIGAAGEGYSKLGNIHINRWRSDWTSRSDGIFCYIRNLTNDETWSAAFQPIRNSPDFYEVIFTEGKAEFKRRDGAIETHMEITVSPEQNIEIRRIRIRNRGKTPAKIQMTSFMEVSLSDFRSDESHPAFNKLFLKTEIAQSHKGIICQRRPRKEGDQCPWIFHSAVVHGASSTDVSYETDRYQFIGRGHNQQDPRSLFEHLKAKEGYVLDPSFSIRKTLEIKPLESVTIDLIFGEGRDRDDCLGLMTSFREKLSTDRIFELSWAHAQVVLQQLNIDAPTAQMFNRIAGYILYPQVSMRPSVRSSSDRPKGQPALWGHGISGDLPIIILRISRTAHVGLLRELVIAQTYWRRKGLATDLIIWNEDETSYRQQLQDEIIAVISHTGANPSSDGQGSIFVIRPEQILTDDKLVMQKAACITFNAQDGTSLAEQLANKLNTKAKESIRLDEKISPISSISTKVNKSGALKGPALNHEGTEYHIPILPNTNSPLPWVNVIANPTLGTVVSERGSSYTWYENAHEFRLTPWHNDPISDSSGESYYIQDSSTGLFWSPMPWPANGENAYLTKHGFGYSIFEHTSSGIRSETFVFVDADEPVKYVMIKLHNDSGRRRELSITGACDWVLGDHRSKSAMHITTDFENGAIFARSHFLLEETERTAFFSTKNPTSWSADRHEVLGDLRNWCFPLAMYKAQLSGRTGFGLDPCAALRVAVTLDIGASKEIVFMLGAGRNRQHARELARLATTIRPPAKALRNVRQVWRDRLSRVTIETPDAKLNALANGWLLYQTISSRLFARSGFYQSGGAFGFRDQLQDVMALIHHEPGLSRAQILRCAEQQFTDGDVLHWWHPPSGRGIRTRFSDDYLWLPYVTAYYVERTGDRTILDEMKHFIEGPQLKTGEESHYGQPMRSERLASLYDHCLLALKNGLRFGQHGLPLMGCGDWNDGMNLVGINGRGESVWLAFFLGHVLEKFKYLAKLKGDLNTIQMCDQYRNLLKDQVDLNAWDGKWYLRAFFDDGTPLGSSQSSECKIDLLPQSWGVLSGMAPEEKARTAMQSVEDILIKKEEGLIQLFDPPFEHTTLNPGYIKGYPPGVRENGGQYTHAAIWAIWAFAQLGDLDRAWDLLDMINPFQRDRSLETINRYMTEPYVVAADVYSKPPHTGRGGWTWYTGAAGWMYQLILERLLGIVRQGEQLLINPKLRSNWKEYFVRYQFKSSNYRIQVIRKKSGHPTKTTLDGVEQAEGSIALHDDGMNHLAIFEI